MSSPPDRGELVRSSGDNIRWALALLMAAMAQEPGPYPDPACPITKWQFAHEHLLAAQELLKDGA